MWKEELIWGEPGHLANLHVNVFFCYQETFSGMFKKISNFRNMLAEYISNALSEKRTVVMAVDNSAYAELAFDCKYVFCIKNSITLFTVTSKGLSISA
jgi:hypothetical protein